MDAEPFKVCSGKVEVDLVSAMVDLGDLEYGPGPAFSGDLVAYAGLRLRLGFGGFLFARGHVEKIAKSISPVFLYS